MTLYKRLAIYLIVLVFVGNVKENKKNSIEYQKKMTMMLLHLRKFVRMSVFSVRKCEKKLIFPF